MALRRWRGPLVSEGSQTGDGRIIAEGAVVWADPPLPFAYLIDGDQHVLGGSSPQVGTIDTITREGSDIVGSGVIDDETEAGAELIRRMEAGTASNGNRQLVSIDPDDWALEVVATGETADAEGELLLVASGRGPVSGLKLTAAAGDGDPGGTVLLEDSADAVLERYTRLRIRGVTAVAVSAFTEAWIELDDEPADAVAVEPAPEEAPPVAAAASPFALIQADTVALQRPPAEAFAIPEPDVDSDGLVEVYGMPAQELLVEQPDGSLAVPFTIAQRPDGHRVCFGHAARWGQCHIGYPECVEPPSSPSSYYHFHHGHVVCQGGEDVPTGVLTIGCDHAAADLGLEDARDHYANAGLGFADVRAHDGRFGIWVSGAIRPHITDAQVRLIQASSPSGDWRGIDGDLEFVAACMVNVPGFGIARESVTAAGLTVLPSAALAPAAHYDDGTIVSLTASGIVHRCPECQARAMAARSGAPLDRPDEVLEIARILERRTRHLRAAAADGFVSRIRP